MARMMGCIMNWGCDASSLESLIMSILTFFLIVPAYLVYAFPQMIFGEPNLPTNVLFLIIGIIDIIWLYLLSCIMAPFVKNIFKK
jgi:hypothetical protein